MNSSIDAGLTAPLPPDAWLAAADGRRMAFSAYPAQRPHLHLLISHGFGEHRGWYHHVARYLQAAGISAYTFDHFHHGISDGKPGDVSDYRVLADGVRLALAAGVLPRRSPGEAVALLGHSNGGLAILRALPHIAPGTVDGLLLSNPLLGMLPATEFWGMLSVRLLSLIHPGLMVVAPNHPARLSSNQSVWKDYRRDRLRLKWLSLRFFREMVATARKARDEASCQGLPLLLLCSQHDRVVDRSAPRDWFERLRAPGKQLIAYPGAEHELFNETIWRAVLADAAAWLKELASPPSIVAQEAVSSS